MTFVTHYPGRLQTPAPHLHIPSLGRRYEHPVRSQSTQPVRRTALLTSMDNRFKPEHLKALSVQPACIVTTEEDRITDGAIRSLLTAAKLWQANDWLLVRLRPEAELQAAIHHLDGANRRADVERQVAEELAQLHHHPSIGASIRIRGFIWEGGRFSEVLCRSAWL